MKQTYLRAAMLDIGEWIREWNPGEVVILLWWLCRGLQWRGDMVPTAQLHKTKTATKQYDPATVVIVKKYRMANKQQQRMFHFLFASILVVLLNVNKLKS